MKILVVSGIWPPDVGGPASHAPEVADALYERGHAVEVVTTASEQPAERPYQIRFVSRTLPPGLRHAAAALLVARRSRTVDVVYATSMVGRSAFASTAPLVVKVAGDAAYERALRRGLFEGRLADFQTARVDPRVAALRRWRTLTVARAAHVFCPSEFLRAIVVSWGIPADRVSVLPNAAPPPPALPPRASLRASFNLNGPTLAFAGRMTRAKALETALAAMEQLEDVSLVLAGDGEERAALEARAPSGVRFLGALPRTQVLELLCAADAALLSSSWENFPHVLVEALAVGTPIIATDVGGVPEIVEDGVNGLLVPPGDPDALAAAIGRFVGDRELQDRLRAAAAPSARRFAPDVVLDRLERELERVVRTLGA